MTMESTVQGNHYSLPQALLMTTKLKKTVCIITVNPMDNICLKR